MGQLSIIKPSDLGHTDETRLRIAITDVGQLTGPLEYAVEFQVGRRHQQLWTAGHSKWRGRHLDLLPSGTSDIISAMLWGEPGDAAKAVVDLERARRRYGA